MSLSLYEVSIPVYLRMLGNLAAILEKAEGHGGDLEALTQAQLAPDMRPLIAQIQMASDGAKGGAARLAGIEPPSFADTETTFAEMKARIAKTVDFVKTVTPEQVNGREDATVVLTFPNGSMTFTGRSFLLDFSLPNFMFHVVTAY
ncbi:MAG: hypothetical protein JWO33_2707, partial [Caulobacteraceae bacterium]|nr:hypothetical protein [Caulobacteraceae bacterium]